MWTANKTKKKKKTQPQLAVTLRSAINGQVPHHFWEPRLFPCTERQRQIHPPPPDLHPHHPSTPRHALHQEWAHAAPKYCFWLLEHVASKENGVAYFLIATVCSLESEKKSHTVWVIAKIPGLKRGIGHPVSSLVVNAAPDWSLQIPNTSFSFFSFSFF